MGTVCYCLVLVVLVVFALFWIAWLQEVYKHQLALPAPRFCNYYWRRRLLYWNWFIPGTSVSVMSRMGGTGGRRDTCILEL